MSTMQSLAAYLGIPEKKARHWAYEWEDGVALGVCDPATMPNGAQDIPGDVPWPPECQFPDYHRYGHIEDPEEPT